MGIETISGGIAVRLETISGLRVYATVEIPQDIKEFPSAIILPGVTNYNTTMSSDVDYNFVITLIFAKQDQPSALGRLLDYMEQTGTNSVVAAIESDTTLNSTADDCKLIRNNGIIPIEWGGIQYLGTTFDLAVWA